MAGRGITFFQFHCEKRGGMKQATYNGITVYFDDRYHTYTDNANRSYLSITSLTKSIFPKFDSDTHALRIATRDGTTKEAVLERWKATAQESCDNGTRVHLLAEKIIRRNSPLLSRFRAESELELPEPRDEKERQRFASVWNAIELMKQGGLQFLAAEMILFDEQHLIAGTADMVACEGATSPGRLWVLDWKTSKELSLENKYNQFALEPFRHIPAIDLAKYTFQLRLYERMINNHGLFDGSDGRPETDCMIIHIKPGTEEPVFVPVPRIDADIDRLLSIRKGRINGNPF